MSAPDPLAADARRLAPLLDRVVIDVHLHVDREALERLRAAHGGGPLGLLMDLRIPLVAAPVPWEVVLASTRWIDPAIVEDEVDQQVARRRLERRADGSLGATRDGREATVGLLELLTEATRRRWAGVDVPRIGVLASRALAATDLPAARCWRRALQHVPSTHGTLHALRLHRAEAHHAAWRAVAGVEPDDLWRLDHPPRRQDVEDETDRLGGAVLAALPQDERDELAQLLRALPGGPLPGSEA